MKLLHEYIKEVLEHRFVVEPESQIFCDMDGVLVNFVETIISMVNRNLAGEEPEGATDSKGYHSNLRKVQNELGVEWRVSNASDLNIKVVRSFMFGAISINPGPIFASMQPYSDAIDALWPFLNSTGHTVNLLTAPVKTTKGECVTCEDGKITWATQYLHPSPTDIIIVPAIRKVEYATTNGIANILIDDRQSTVNSWNNAGGIAVLHTPSNSGSTIQKLRNMGL